MPPTFPRVDKGPGEANLAAMTDVFTPAQRSSLMSRIRSRDTKPEMEVRQLIHAMGFRCRLHRKDLPGTPDITLPRWNAIVAVNGCFFHGCPRCDRGRRLPKSNQSFWHEKIRRNRERDTVAAVALKSAGWRVMTVWECALRGAEKMSEDALRAALQSFICGSEITACLPEPERADTWAEAI